MEGYSLPSKLKTESQRKKELGQLKGQLVFDKVDRNQLSYQSKAATQGL